MSKKKRKKKKKKWWRLLLEGLLSMGPTPSSFFMYPGHNCLLCPPPTLVIWSQKWEKCKHIWSSTFAKGVQSYVEHSCWCLVGRVGKSEPHRVHIFSDSPPNFSSITANFDIWMWKLQLIWKLNVIDPVNNRPSPKEIHHFVQNKQNISAP